MRAVAGLFALKKTIGFTPVPVFLSWSPSSVWTLLLFSAAANIVSKQQKKQQTTQLNHSSFLNHVVLPPSTGVDSQNYRIRDETSSYQNQCKCLNITFKTVKGCKELNTFKTTQQLIALNWDYIKLVGAPTSGLVWSLFLIYTTPKAHVFGINFVYYLFYTWYPQHGTVYVNSAGFCDIFF